jgi:hypothetical protein
MSFPARNRVSLLSAPETLLAQEGPYLLKVHGFNSPVMCSYKGLAPLMKTRDFSPPVLRTCRKAESNPCRLRTYKKIGGGGGTTRREGQNSSSALAIAPANARSYAQASKANSAHPVRHLSLESD